jgi:hypothetical protein
VLALVRREGRLSAATLPCRHGLAVAMEVDGFRVGGSHGTGQVVPRTDQGGGKRRAGNTLLHGIEDRFAGT